MKRTPLLLSLALLGALSLSPLAAAAEKVPTAEQVCTALTKAAKKAGKKADAKTKAEAKGRLALAAAIKRLAKEPENVNVRSKGKGLTPLMIAAALGEKNAIRWLISIGGDPTVKDADGKDAFARTKNTAITKLLKEGAILSWDEAIAYLESIRPEDWRKPQSASSDWVRRGLEEGGSMSRNHMLNTCRELAKTENPNVERHILEDCTMLGLCKMVSFLLRDCAERGVNETCSIFFDCDNFLTDIPSEQLLPMLNIYKAHQVEIRHGHAGCYKEEITTNAKLCRWISDDLGWEYAIGYGASMYAPHMIRASLQSIKDSPTPVPADKLQEVLDNALCRCEDYDARDARAGIPVNPYLLEAATILLEAGAQRTMDENHPDGARSVELKKLLKTAAKKKQSE